MRTLGGWVVGCIVHLRPDFKTADFKRKEMRGTMKKLTQGATRLAAALSLVVFSFGGKGAS